MGFFRRIAGIFGFPRDEAHGGDKEHEDRTAKIAPPRPTKGFSVQAPVAVERPHLGPILVPCNLGEGGVQGFRWYARRLRVDEDGDIADEFLDQVLPEAGSGAEGQLTPPWFEVKYKTRPATVKKQIIAVNGNIHQSIESQGKLQWV